MYYRSCIPPKLPQPSGAVHSIWWFGFFFDLFSYSGLRAFFTSDFTNCTTDYAPPNYPNHQVLFTASDGWGFFDLFSYSGLRAFFTSYFTNCTTDYVPPQITPTIRCCSQHLMVGFFFFDLFSYSGLRAFFTSDFTNCTTDYAPSPNYANHQVLFTASDGWVFFFISSPILDLEYFSQVILWIVLPDYAPSPNYSEPSGAVHSIWWLGFFFFDLFSYSGLRAFFTSDFTNCTTDYDHPPKITRTIRCCSQHLMVGVFFFDLFSYSGLRAFFTSDFTNCTTDYDHPPKITRTIRCCSQHLMVGVFFLISSPILDLEHFSQVILRIVLQIMPPPKLTQPSGAVHSIWWLGVFFDLFSYSGLRAFFTSDLWIVLQIMPPPQITRTIRCCSQHLMVGGFFLTSSPILDLEHFSQVILRIVLQIMPTPENNPNHQVLFTASDGWGFFFDLFSYSGLRAFFTSDFTNCTTDHAPPEITPTIRCCSQHMMVGVFFWSLLLFWT